jgi:hypothetical protein
MRLSSRGQLEKRAKAGVCEAAGLFLGQVHPFVTLINSK